MIQIEDLARRIRELESRVAALENARVPSKSSNPTTKNDIDPRNIILISVTGKRFEAENEASNLNEDHIWFDCAFEAIDLTHPTRAIKGIIEFCDLFNEPIFNIGYTINEPLEPNGTLSAPGIGFVFNEFRDEHKWMFATNLNDMKIYFRLMQILYKDGTTESFNQT